MQAPPIGQSEIERRIEDHLDELLELWWAEQGAAKRRDLELMATIPSFASERPLNVLDLCCGPGDVGRSIKDKFPNSVVDYVDRDLFLIEICRGVNRRKRVEGRYFVRDLWDSDWRSGLKGEYQVVATANALHWLNVRRVAELVRDVFGLLGSDGIFMFVEPVSVEKTFAARFAEWKSRQPSRYSQENWQRFWMRANEILGYDHTKLLGSRDSSLIGDVGMTVSSWVELIKGVGFVSIEILLRDADEVIIAARKP